MEGWLTKGLIIGYGQKHGVICARVVTTYISVDEGRKREKENEKKNCRESAALKDV